MPTTPFSNFSTLSNMLATFPALQLYLYQLHAGFFIERFNLTGNQRVNIGRQTSARTSPRRIISILTPPRFLIAIMLKIFGRIRKSVFSCSCFVVGFGVSYMFV
jgi:hypothetical protein